ncbi:MAG TPA: GDSL-type esterase/lipase family protein, partial [Kofleriaceae bacterium]
GTPDACKRWAMDAFYDAVAKEQSGKLGRAARVSWYGDSVIAADTIPARLRGKLQADWGDGGPGYVFVVEPHRFCFHEAVTRSHTGNWLTHAISTLPSVDGMYGAGGASAEATGGGGATFKLVSGKASRVELYYLAQPNGGTATVLADNNEVVTADTSGDAKVAKGASAMIDGGAAKFSIATKGRVRLFGIGFENDKGVVVDNFGIVSVNVKNFATRQTENWEAELKHRAADLLIISIGANEAHWLGPKDTATKLYSGQFKAMLEPIRTARPDASCLVISPLDQAEANDTGYESRPVMPVIVQAQREAAKAAGCAFFAAYDWQGGRGSSITWFKKGLVGSDFIHLSKKGATKLADAVYQALTAGYHEHVGH